MSQRRVIYDIFTSNLISMSLNQLSNYFAKFDVPLH